MFNYIWPIGLVVLSNIIYHICAKHSPYLMNPLASLTITYAVAAVVSGILFFILNPNVSIIKEYAKTNWAPFVLGIAIIGLEAGWLYAYKAGWPISTSQVVQSVICTIALIAIGAIIYHEGITLTKIAGIVICLIGLALINK